MNHNDHYIFVFVRQDISVYEQLIHSGHANWHAGNRWFTVNGLPNMVLIGLPHIGALAKVVRKLNESEIAHYIWDDPDTKYGPTAIVTEPLSVIRKEPLKNYRLYSPGAAKSACLLIEDGGAKADVAQLREHPVSNRGVEGENPSVGSKL